MEAELFRGRIGFGAQQGGVFVLAGFETAAGIEVDEAGRTVRFHQDMFGLDVPVDDAQSMELGEALAECEHDLAGVALGEVLAALTQAGQTLTVDILFHADDFVSA